MTASYPATAGTVNTAPSAGALSFYRWLYRWHSQTGSVAPSTGYLAHKQGKTERTIYRWLSELLSCSYIETQVSPGVERRIVPLVPPPPRNGGKVRQSVTHLAPTTSAVSRVMSGVVSGVVSGVYPVDAHTQDTTTQGNHVAATPLSGSDCEQVAAAPLPESPVVLALCDAGVTASTAGELVRERGERECLEQLEALPYRKPVDAPSVLVASIRGKWSLPGSLVREREKRRKEVARVASVQARAVVQEHQRQVRAEALERLSALPVALYESLEARALSLWHQEQPAAARLMSGRVGAASVVHRYMVRLLDGEGGGVHA